jgi:hypothetical protein
MDGFEIASQDLLEAVDRERVAVHDSRIRGIEYDELRASGADCFLNRVAWEPSM